MTVETHLLLATIATLVSMLLAVGMGIFVLLHDLKKPEYRMFFLMCLSIGAYLLSFAIGINLDPPYAYWVWYTNIAEDILIGVFTLHCFVRVSDGYDHFKPTLIVMYAIGAVLIALSVLFPQAFLVDVLPTAYFRSYTNASGLLYYLVDAYFLAAFIITFFVLFFERTRHGSEGKKRIDYYIFALAYGFGTGVTAFAPDFNLPIDPSISVLLGFYVVPIMYGMVKKDLMDIRIAVRKTVLFTVLIAGVTGILTAVSLLSEWFYRTIPGFSSWIVPFLAALVSVVVGSLYWYKAGEAERLKAEFITIVTHKFRTPLTRIRWQSEALAQSTDLSPEVRAGVDQIRNSALELIQLSNLLVDAVRVERENYQYAYADTDLPALVTRVVGPFKEEVDSKHIRLTIDTAPHMPPVHADAERLADAIHVFIENAVSYTPPGGAIDIRLTSDRDTVRFAVTDTGIGLTENDRARVFSRFFRSDRARRADTEGVGLGLSMARNILERHKGSVGVESKGAGQGSTFWFTLPVSVKKNV